MKHDWNGRKKSITVAATAAFYFLFAAVVVLDPRLLSPFVDARFPLLGGLLLPLWRGAAGLLITFSMALAIYLTYGALTRTHWFARRRISPKSIEPGQVQRETLLNVNFALAAGIQGTAYLILTRLGLSKIYVSVDERGWAYAMLSMVLFAVLADAWFYFWHRYFHRSHFVFRNVHSVHHLSVVTTPMTNSQISPWELLPSGLFGVLFVMSVPVAMPVMGFFVLVVPLYQMILHSGYEIFPRGTAAHWLGKWLVTPTYHQMHHELFVRHMGLYFTWWDRLFGTYSDAYIERFAKITARTGA